MRGKKFISNSIQAATFLVLTLISGEGLKGYAERHERPLWTPKDAVTYPEVSIGDISPDGKYSLIQISRTILQGKKAKQFSQCALINNENLKKVVIGDQTTKCYQPRFIGEGKKFSYILHNFKNGKETLFVQDVESQTRTPIKKLENNFYNYKFAPNGKSFAFIRIEYPENRLRIVEGEEKRNQLSLYLQKLDQNFQLLEDPELLTPSDVNLNAFEFSPSYGWSPDSQKIAFTSSKLIWMSGPYTEVNVLNLSTKKIDKIAEGLDFFYNLLFSPDGQSLLFLKLTGGGNQIGSIKPSPETCHQTIHVVELKTQKETSLPVEDIWSVKGWNENGKGLIIQKQKGTKQLLGLLDIETQTLTFLPTPYTSSISDAVLSKDRKYIGFVGQDLHHPEEAYVSSIQNFAPKKITSFTKGIDLSSIKAYSLTWKSSDGTDVEGILIYPQGYKKGQKVPLIVSLHGGPQGVQSEEFIGNGSWFGAYSPAFFASQGFATLAVNYRGSLGYGRRFTDLDYKDLGGGDFKDVMAGVDYLITQGIADPDQLFIRGHSYGGFLTVWAIGQTNRFKAAVVEAGIIEWISDNSTTDVATAMEGCFGGPYWDDYDLYRKASPLSYIENMSTPTLIRNRPVSH